MRRSRSCSFDVCREISPARDEKLKVLLIMDLSCPHGSPRGARTQRRRMDPPGKFALRGARQYPEAGRVHHARQQPAPSASRCRILKRALLKRALLKRALLTKPFSQLRPTSVSASLPRKIHAARTEAASGLTRCRGERDRLGSGDWYAYMCVPPRYRCSFVSCKINYCDCVECSPRFPALSVPVFIILSLKP